MITHSLTISGLDSGEIQTAMAESLRKDGWSVYPPPGVYPNTPGETPSAWCARVGFHPGSFARCFHRHGRPAVAFEVGKGGRIKRVWSTPEFEAWMRRYKRGTVERVRGA